MEDTLLFRVQRDKTRRMEEAVESWQTNHKSALLLDDADELIRLSVDLPGEMRRLTDAVVARIAKNQVDDLRAAGEELAAFFNEQLGLLDAIADLLRHGQAEGVTADHATAVETARKAIAQLKQTTFAHWPWPLTPAEIAEAHAAYERGEYETVEAILHELQGKRP